MTIEADEKLMCAPLSFKEVDRPGTYLGLPTVWGRSKKEALVFIKERTDRKIEGWTLEGMMPYFIKSVVSASMSCFMFPKIYEEINAAMENFWCGSSDHGNKVHRKGWSSRCIPKEDGGIGFKDLNHYNITLLAKQCWHILPQPSLWVKVQKARYFQTCDFLEATKEHLGAGLP
ncbi:hypothetical protein ACLB2K_015748 [Fragaria x ananassa]